MPLTLTRAMLIGIVPSLSPERAQKIADTLNLVMPRYGMDSSDIFHEFIANVAHETQGLTRFEENLNYSAPQLLQVFPKYFTAEVAAKYAGNKVGIGNRVYANRMGNGSESSGDGYCYRGGGCLHLTGKDMYQAYERYKKTGLPIQVLADKIRTEDAWAIDSACWVFAVQKHLIDASLRDDLTATVKAINGGLNGLEDRKTYYERAKAAVK